MGMAAPVYYTAEMVRNMPDDGQRYEVVRGELQVTPAPGLWHQEIVGRIYAALTSYLATERVGQSLLSPADISWAPDMLCQPDVFVAPLSEARTLDWSQLRHLLLVVEVLSPSSARADRFTKRLEYQRQAVPLYWIIDPDQHQAECWTPADTFPRLERQQVTWQPEGATSAFELSLEALFRAM